MIQNKLLTQKSPVVKIILGINILFLLLWLIANNFNVYQVAMVGAIYELIWLPLIIGLFSLPIISFIYWKKDSFKLKSHFLYLIILSVFSIVLLLII